MTRGRSWAALAVGLTALACGGTPDPQLIEEYRSQRDEALSHARKVPSTWAPDVVLHLSPDTLESGVTAALEVRGAWTDEIEAGTATLEPELEVSKLSLRTSDVCDTCIEIDATLEGETHYRAGIAGRGTVETKIDIVADIRIDTVDTKTGWKVTCAPEKVSDLDLRVPGLPKVVRDLARKPLLAWVEDNLLDDFEPVVLAVIGGEELPLRALRVVPQGTGGMRIEALTDAKNGGEVPVQRPKASVPWKLDVSEQSLLWLARREAFATGASSLGLAAIPESLTVEEERFTLGLRLWRTSGSGWWRDYTVKGELHAKPKKIQLKPESVEEVDASPGAVRADPLAALAQSVILSSIEDAIAMSLPARGSATVSGLQTELMIDHVTGAAGTMSVQGELEFSVP